MNSQARAIVRAQLRSLLNHYAASNKIGLSFGVVLASLWYGSWLVLAILIARVFAASGAPLEVLSSGLLFVCLYWQIVPVLLVSTGVSLSNRKLQVYPIPLSQLFRVELMLRITTSFEMVLVLAGLAAGLSANSRLPGWAALGLLPLAAFNLCVSVGVRELMVRMFERRRVREIAVLLLVMIGALPQLTIVLGYEAKVGALFRGPGFSLWPWAAAADIAAGRATFAPLVALTVWTTAAWAFGRWQFSRTLRFDSHESNATPRPTRETGLFAGFLRWPSFVFHDPLAALVEKEIRVLTRAPRFRLALITGCTVGLIIWLPLAVGRSHSSAFGRNYLAFTCSYALLLVGDVCVWNSLGIDRFAAQAYWAMPVRFATVLVGKNISAVFFVLVETTIITLACSLLRMPVDGTAVAEAYAVTLVASLYLIAMGNLTSTSNARPIDPAKAMRSGAPGRLQALMLLLYPVAAGPVLLAYGARYAFDSETAFFLALLIAALVGGVVYGVSLDSAVEAAERNKERLLTALAQGEGVIEG